MRRLLPLLLAAWALVGLLAPAAYAASGDGPDGEARVVRVGTEGTYPPFTYEDPRSGELTGYDVDVIEAVAKEAGWRLEFRQAQFDAIFPSLDADRIDVIANQISVNPEREARYLFSEPYTYSRGVIVTRAGTDDIASLEDLRGKTTAQSSTSNWATIARDAGARVETVEGFAQAAELLVQGRVDAIVNDNIAVLDYLATTGSDQIQVSGDAGEGSEQALAFRQDSPELRDEADAALDRLRDDGTLREISEKWFDADVSVEDGGDVSVDRGDTRSTWQVVRDTAGPMLWAALKVTLPLTAVSFATGLAIAVLVALARMSSNPLLQGPARFYISIIRGTPLLVQLFIFFFGLPQLGVTLPSFLVAWLALSLNVGGYAAEVVRGAILSVPRGQYEAATAIGMGFAQSMRRVILPQASRIAVPPLGNTLLSLVKDTSLVSIVTLTDLLRVATVEAGATTEYLALYVLAAAYYWVICFVVSQVQERVEARLEAFAT
ncbi:ABC transporter substrate-binding protein/permease [Nocardioides marmoraquaticus]